MVRRVWLAGRRRSLARVAAVVVGAVLAGPVQALAGNDVPLRGSDAGTWGEGTHQCGGLYPVFVATEGRASHLGRYEYSSRECVNFGASGYEGTFVITTADGASMYGTYAGSFTVVDDTIHYEQENAVTGGGGRFAGATGGFHVSGLASLTDPSDTQVLEGSISSVGSTK
jgi:hypothetical protein